MCQCMLCRTRLVVAKLSSCQRCRSGRRILPAGIRFPSHPPRLDSSLALGERLQHPVPAISNRALPVQKDRGIKIGLHAPLDMACQAEHVGAAPYLVRQIKRGQWHIENRKVLCVVKQLCYRVPAAIAITKIVLQWLVLSECHFWWLAWFWHA